jgi:uncharacterized protein
MERLRIGIVELTTPAPVYVPRKPIHCPHPGKAHAFRDQTSLASELVLEQAVPINACTTAAGLKAHQSGRKSFAREARQKYQCLSQNRPSRGALRNRGGQRNGESKMANEQRGGSGNFANDPERASEAGRKGGEHKHGGQPGQGGQHGPHSQGGQHSGSAKDHQGSNFANDPEKARDAGRKGGQR